jgi:hypothetical protein
MMRHALPDAVHKQTEQNSVHRGAGRLIQQGLDDGVALVEPGLDDAAAGGLVIELGVVGCGGGRDGLLGGRDVVGREGRLEVVLPEEIGGRGEQGEEGVLKDGDPVYYEGFLRRGG